MAEGNNTKSAIPTRVSAAGTFRDFISEDSDTFQPESGRYHLYIALGCPFAHRANFALKLKGLEDHIGLTICHPTFQKTKPEVDDHKGWVFRAPTDEPLKNPNGFGSFPCDGCIPDPVNNFKTIREIYESIGSPVQKYSVPVLYDKKLKTIVNNESADILRILNSGFNKLAKHPEIDLYSENLREQIDKTSEWIVSDLATGVYKTGFAQKQEDYDKNVEILFKALDRAEEILSKSRYLVGNQLTEADVKLFVVLVRFDEVYHGHFKCNKKRIVDYPNLLNFSRELYQLPNIDRTVNMEHIKRSYYGSMSDLNYYGIIPEGNDFVERLKEKHDRNRF